MEYDRAGAAISGAMATRPDPCLLDEVGTHSRFKHCGLCMEPAYRYGMRRYVRGNGTRHRHALNGQASLTGHKAVTTRRRYAHVLNRGAGVY